MSEDSRWADAWEQTSSLLALRELTRLSEQVAPAVANRAGLTHNELRTLEHLIAGPMGPGELSRVLGVSSAASSGIIDRLEKRGHAQRVSHASDGRRTSVTISDSGRAEVVGHLMPMFRELAELDAASPTPTARSSRVTSRGLPGRCGGWSEGANSPGGPGKSAAAARVCPIRGARTV